MNLQRTSTKHLLTRRRLHILAHVARYRLTTIEALNHTVLLQLPVNTVTKIASRMCQADYLCKYTLLHPRPYFVLGAAGARCLGLGHHRTAPLGPQTLPTEFAVLVYATLGPQPRLRLTLAEVQSRCPWLPPALALAPHCADTQNDILDLVRIDLGGPAHHVARKCAKDLTERQRLPDFGPFVATGRFRLVVITATPTKARALRQALDNHDWPRGLRIHLAIVPQLLSLTATYHQA